MSNGHTSAGDEPGPPDQPPTGRLQPISAAAVTGWAVTGLVAGWVAHPAGEWLLGTAPIVTWTQVLVLFGFAAVLAGTAWLTWRTVQVQGRRLPPEQGVNRLVLGRASALVGALAAGAYGGYAVSWLGLEAELASQRLWRSVLAALGAGLVLAAGILLERACRVHSRPNEP